jgi:hypothetical protein
MQNKLWCNMVDVLNNGPLPSSTNKPCWWCRHTFYTRPIGCPLKYIHDKPPGLERDRIVEKFEKADLPTDGKVDFFETEGYFCSLPCCKGYILDQKGYIRYKESLGLLYMMCKILYGSNWKTTATVIEDDGKAASEDIPAAPSWKLLKEYGGHLSIQEFRASFGKFKYDESVCTRRPYLFCSSQYIFEKKIKLFRGVQNID